MGPKPPLINPAEEALECFNKALEFDPQHADAWYNKGVLLTAKYLGTISRLSLWRSEEEKEYGHEALECFDKALAYDPNNRNALCFKGILLYVLNKPKPLLRLRDPTTRKALECFNKALEIDPQYIDALCFKGILLRESQQYIGALECFNKALEIDQNNKQILRDREKVISYLNIAKDRT